jgi:cell division transport system permease protein
MPSFLRLGLSQLRDVFKDLMRYRGQHALAVMALSSGLMIAGGGLLAVETLDRWVGKMESLARITVFAAEGARLDEAWAKLRQDPRFLDVKLITSQDATRRFLSTSRDAGLMVQSLGGESIPENLELTLKPELARTKRAVDVGESLRGLPGVGDVVVDQERLQAFQNTARLVRGALGFLGLLLLLAAGFSTGNVIRMTIMAREEEITIMRLVGATEGYIRWPLVLEGAALGFAASTFAAVGLFGFWSLISRGFGGLPPLLVELARMGFFSWKSLLLLASIGTGTGALGSLWGFRATQSTQKMAAKLEESLTE